MPQDNNTNMPDNNMTSGQPSSDNGGAGGMFLMNDYGLPTKSDVVVMPGMDNNKDEKPKKMAKSDVKVEIATKMGEAKNVLIALSKDPSIDELSAAIGLSLYLDKMGKRATAIYSGATPNVLEFLRPEDRFESTADTLQDFVIAINKDKADHLRYKLDGGYVKVYITPYKHRLSEEDLEFSYGDYNVDLVIALDVASGSDLDSALREHGRIMHDASIINLTTGEPGNFGEIEWSNKRASSISEMLASLLYEFGGDEEITRDEATAFLSGIVAETARFSNSKTTPQTMRISSKLMESGANQQLVAKHVTPDIREVYIEQNGKSKIDSLDTGDESADSESLTVGHSDNEDALSDSVNEEILEKKEEEHSNEVDLNDDAKTDNKGVKEEVEHDNIAVDSINEQDKDTKDNVGLANEPVKDSLNTGDNADNKVDSEEASDSVRNDEVDAKKDLSIEHEETNSENRVDASNEVNEDNGSISKEGSDSNDTGLSVPQEEKVIPVPTEPSAFEGSSDKYGKMVQDMVSKVDIPSKPVETISSKPDDETENPISNSVPVVPSVPEANDIPEMTLVPPTENAVLPPPPVPPVSMNDVLPQQSNNTDETVSVVGPVQGPAPGPAPVNQPNVPPIQPALSAAQPTPLGNQPVMQDQVYTPQQNDSSAFRIPGM